VKRDDSGVLFAKNGGLPGVHTYIEHRPDNVDWVFYFNGTGIDQKPKLMGAAMRSLHQTIEAVNKWPQSDLFAQYQ